jgi:DNA-binding transcriptional MerR regulator
MGDMPMRAQMAAAGYGGGAMTKGGAKTFLKKGAYGDELNLPEIESLRARGVSDSQLAKWIKKQEIPLGSQAAAIFGLDRLSSGANLRPEYVEQFKDAGYSNKEIRKAYKGGTGRTIEDRAAEMVAPRGGGKKEFDLASYDPATKGGQKFGIRDLEFLRSKGLSDKEITKYAEGLDSALIGGRAASALGLGSVRTPETPQAPTKKEERIDELKATNQELRDKIQGLKSDREQTPERATELLNKTISNITSTYRPETSTVSTPTMLGGTQIVSPSVTYGGSFSPEMKAPISQTIRGGGDVGNIRISSEMSPTYKDIGNIAASIDGVTAESLEQKGGITTDIGGIRAEVDNLIEKAKAKRK